MPQPTTKHSPLSVQRAFVVHFQLETDVRHERIAGRVEHVVSGQRAHFQSLQEFLTFIEQILTREHNKEDAR